MIRRFSQMDADDSEKTGRNPAIIGPAQAILLNFGAFSLQYRRLISGLIHG